MVKRWPVVGRNNAYQPELMDVVKASDYDAISAELAAVKKIHVDVCAMAQERIRELKQALERYGAHIGNCKWGDPYPTGRPHPCTCGLLAACPHFGEPAALDATPEGVKQGLQP